MLSRPGETATPKEITDRFEIALSTLRSRREALDALGVKYIEDGKNTRYCEPPNYPAMRPIAGYRRVPLESDPATPS